MFILLLNLLTRLYDYNIYKSGDYLKNIIICSKDNPIRIININGKKNIVKTYVIRNQVEEIVNPVCLKINQFVIKLMN